MVDLLKMDDKVLLDKVVKDFDKAEKQVDNLKPTWEDSYRKYKSKLKKLKEGKANLFIPYTWATVEQLKARALQALFSKPPYVSYAGVGEDDTDGALIMERLVQYQMKEKIKLPFKFIFALNSIFNYGTAIALTDWKHEEKSIKKRQNIIDETIGAKTGEEIIDTLVTIYDDPDVEFFPLDEFFPDPEGYDIESCNYCCTRVYRDEAYLRSKEKEGIYTLPEQLDNGGNTSIDFRDNVNNLSSSTSDKTKNHEIISYYTDDVKIVVLNRKYILQKVENQSFTKDKPFQRIVAFPLEKEFYGMSIVEVISNLQDELNTTRNQRIDNISFILNKAMLKRRNAEFDTEIKLYPGAVIEVDDIHNDLKPLEFGDVTSSALMEEEKIKQDIQFVSSVSEYARGATPARKETATTVVSIQDASNTVFNYIIMVIENSGLLPIADRIKKLNQQYITEDRVIRLFNTEKGAWEYPNISSEDIQGSYDVVSASPRMETQSTKEGRRAQLLEMFNTLTTNDLTKSYINVPAFIKKLMETYDISDIQSLMQEPPPQIPIGNSQVTPDIEEMMNNQGGNPMMEGVLNGQTQ